MQLKYRGLFVISCNLQRKLEHYPVYRPLNIGFNLSTSLA